MSGRLVCPLAVLVIGSVLSPDPVKSQCTTRGCNDGESEADLRTMVLRHQEYIEHLKQQVSNHELRIRSMEEEAMTKCAY